MTDTALTDRQQPSPLRSLTISWGCFLGGVETALYHRLTALNEQGLPAHAYFYQKGHGRSTFASVPHHISRKQQHLANYVSEHQFDVVTLVNTLYNLELLKEQQYQGEILYEFHGRTGEIIRCLQRINNKQDEEMVRGIVVPSQNVADIASRYLADRPDLPIFIATNTIDTSLFSDKPIETFLDKYKIPLRWMSSPILGWVGRIERNKNWAGLLAIFRLVRKRHRHLKLLMCSDLSVSRDTLQFHKTAKTMGLHRGRDYMVLSNVSHREMTGFYNLVSKSGGALISTSKREGYPYNLLEAQACNCPVVCSGIRGSKALVSHNQTGLVYPRQDALLAAKCVHRLLTDPELRQNVTTQARAKVCAANDIQSNVAAYAEFLASLVHGPSARHPVVSQDAPLPLQSNNGLDNDEGP